MTTGLLPRFGGARRRSSQVEPKRSDSRPLNSCKLLIPLLLGIGALSCKKAETPKPSLRENAVAVVAGNVITSQMLRDELERQFRQGNPELTTAQKLNALQALIQTEALCAKAKAESFDRDPRMEARIKHLIASQFKEARFPATNAAVTEQEIEQFYRENKARYATPPAVRAAIILLEAPAYATPEKRAEFSARAEAVLAEAKRAASTQAFADVVRRHSEDGPSRYRGGDIGWLTSETTGTDSQLVTALAAVEQPGGFAPLVSTPRGTVIAKLLEKRPAGFKPLAEARETIRYQLARQQAQQAEANLQASIKDGLDIQVNQSLLESITLPPEKNEPPKMPGSQTAQIRQ
jgi:parvulin-like peptidyl-prolyl isomerase